MNGMNRMNAMNGMNAEGFKLGSNRGARNRGGHYTENDSTNKQKDNNQRASTGIMVFRLDHSLTNKLTVGTSGLIGQASGENEDLDQTMFTLQAEYVSGAHFLRFLAVENRFHNADDFNEVTSNASNSVNDAQNGAYIEYRHTISGKGTSKYVPFARYEVLNLQADKASGITDDKELEMQQLTVGINYFPLDRIVFKADYTFNRNNDDTGVDEFAMGLGYNF